MPSVSALAERLPERAFASAIAYAHRRFEPVLGQVRTFVSPHQTAIDVGAWYGPWTHWLARVSRDVVTVEANPELAAFVARTAPANVRVVSAAASDSAGSAELWLPPGGRGTEGRASLYPPPLPRPGHERGHDSGREPAPGARAPGRVVQVTTIRLDELDVSDVGVIKIDVEGHELAVLRGAEGIIRRWRPTLVVEVEDARSPAAQTLDLLADWGYQGSFYTGRLWHPLAGFDLAAHQNAHARAAARGYLRVVIDGSGDSYVNTLVFRPQARENQDRAFSHQAASGVRGSFGHQGRPRG
jgi:FkbM family methyltransferase